METIENNCKALSLEQEEVVKAARNNKKTLKIEVSRK